MTLTSSIILHWNRWNSYIIGLQCYLDRFSYINLGCSLQRRTMCHEYCHALSRYTGHILWHWFHTNDGCIHNGAACALYSHALSLDTVHCHNHSSLVVPLAPRRYLQTPVVVVHPWMWINHTCRPRTGLSTALQVVAMSEWILLRSNLCTFQHSIRSKFLDGTLVRLDACDNRCKLFVFLTCACSKQDTIRFAALHQNLDAWVYSAWAKMATEIRLLPPHLCKHPFTQLYDFLNTWYNNLLSQKWLRKHWYSNGCYIFSIHMLTNISAAFSVHFMLYWCHANDGCS